MEQVAYLLGAGFSAPLGLPVMSNFLEKSKDLYFLDLERYGYFDEVLREIAKMSVIKNYYSTDLLNIEEILSVLAMQYGLKGRQLKKAFIRYIADVIDYYTPSFSSRRNSDWPSNWHHSVFRSAGEPGRLFTTFVASLLQLRISTTAGSMSPLRVSSLENTGIQYGVVTLNYDLILENLAKYIAEGFIDGNCAFFKKVPAPKKEELASGGDLHKMAVQLAKLHGSVDTDVMVAPTWNKSLARNLLPAWKAAFEVLAKANHIRIIGYSLPTSDAYIRYLLRAASIESPHLKRIDVLCLDDRNGSVRDRYAEFIDFANFRFVNRDVVDYLTAIDNAAIDKHSVVISGVDFRRLEAAHESFFRAVAT